MKIRLPFVLLPVALVLAGCGQKDASSGASGAAAAPAPAAGPRVVQLTAGVGDQMKYALVGSTAPADAPIVIEAKAGEQLKVVLTNAGTLPKDVMGHNWVLLKAGSDAAGFSAAATVAKDTDYVPPALKDQVIASIGTLGPRKSDEVVFTVPAPGEYPFLCSFPAHYAVGMKGTLVVK